MISIFICLSIFSIVRAQTEMEMFTTSDGVQIAYVDEGKPRLGTIAFVHGGPGYNSAYLRGFAAGLREDFRTIVYDQRGSGRSSRDIPKASITLDRFVEDLHELLEVRKAKDVILLGQSFGGAIVLEYIFAYPQDIQKAILENGFADAQISMEDRVNGVAALCEQKEEPKAKEAIRKYKQGERLALDDLQPLADDNVQQIYWFDPSVQEERFVEGGRERWGYTRETASEVEWIIGAFWDQGLFRSYTALDRLHTIRIPVLVVTGRYDQVTSPRLSRAIVERLQQGQLEILEKSGHYPHIEQPEAFKALLYEFCAQ